MSGMCNMTVVKADLTPCHSFLCAPLPATERKHTLKKVGYSSHRSEGHYCCAFKEMLFSSCHLVSCDFFLYKRVLVWKVLFARINPWSGRRAAIVLLLYSITSTHSPRTWNAAEGITKDKQKSSQTFLREWWLVVLTLGNRKGHFWNNRKLHKLKLLYLVNQQDKAAVSTTLASNSRLLPDLVLGCARCRQQAAWSTYVQAEAAAILLFAS